MLYVEDAGAFDAGKWGNNITLATGITFNMKINGTTQDIDSTHTYDSLTLSGSGTKTADGAFTVNDTLTVSTGTTFDPDSNLITGTGTNVLDVTGTILVDASTFEGNYLSFEAETFNAGMDSSPNV